MHAMQPTLDTEMRLWQAGYAGVAGLDEAGRGCWAGPVYAGAVMLAPGTELPGVRDSKTLAPARRAALLELITQRALSWGVGWATVEEIDALGILPATRLALQRALEQLAPPPQALILDAITLPDIPLPQTAFPRADALALSVAAASIVAKVHRDRWMAEVADRLYPGYGFARHKGYGTAEHQAALAAWGPCPLHRRNFAPIARLLRPPSSPNEPETHRP